MSIEDKYDEVRQLITIGKEKGYLLYDEVNDLLRADIASADELDDLFSTFGSAGIEVIDSEQKYREDKQAEGADDLELDLTPGALDKTNDPVRMYLREMGTVPLLTREGEVEIAKRIERGKLSVIKSISRTPMIARKVIELGDRLRAGERTVRELVIFNDEEITDDRLEERTREVLGQVEAVRRARAAYEKLLVKLATIPRKDKRKFRRTRLRTYRARVVLSRLIREIEFTEMVKRRMVEQLKEQVEQVQRLQRECDSLETALEQRSRKLRLKEDDRRAALARLKELDRKSVV